jgi:hypothetical protein
VYPQRCVRFYCSLLLWTLYYSVFRSRAILLWRFTADRTAARAYVLLIINLVKFIFSRSGREHQARGSRQEKGKITKNTNTFARIRVPCALLFYDVSDAKLSSMYFWRKHPTRRSTLKITRNLRTETPRCTAIRNDNYQDFRQISVSYGYLVLLVAASFDFRRLTRVVKTVQTIQLFLIIGRWLFPGRQLPRTIIIIPF